MSLERALWMMTTLSDGGTSLLTIVQRASAVDIVMLVGGQSSTVTGRDLDEAVAAAISELEQRIDLVSQLEANGAPITNEKETTWPQQ